MGRAPMDAPGKCLFGGFCAPCATYMLRKRLLGGTLQDYKCCQGYMALGCCTPGEMGEKSAPELCLCLESCCCLGCAVSANRFMLMDRYNIISDPCDNRIIVFNNFVQLLSCIISLLAICISELRDAAHILDIIAKIVFYCTVGCMNAQASVELDFREAQAAGQPQQAAPMMQEMSRGPPPPANVVRM